MNIARSVHALVFVLAVACDDPPTPSPRGEPSAPPAPPSETAPARETAREPARPRLVTVLEIAPGDATSSFGERFATDGTRIATGDGRILVRNAAETFEEVRARASRPAELDAWVGALVALHGTDVVRCTSDRPDAPGELAIFDADGRRIARFVGRPDERFCSSLAVSGDRIAVGAEGRRTTRRGSVQLFELADGRWRAGPRATGEGDWHWFGQAVALAGDLLVVGSTRRGVLVFRVRDGALVVEQELEAIGETQLLGRSVATDGARIAVGERWAVRVFERDEGGRWVDRQRIATLDAEPSTFGHSIAISGDVLLVGDAGLGEASVLLREADGWELLRTISLGDRGVGEVGLAIHGDALFIGAPRSWRTDAGGAIRVERLER